MFSMATQNILKNTHHCCASKENELLCKQGKGKGEDASQDAETPVMWGKGRMAQSPFIATYFVRQYSKCWIQERA